MTNNSVRAYTDPIYVYAGAFLISLGTLTFEVTLARLLSVITWYHLAFFAVSTGMLGMTAGAITVYLKPAWFAQQKLSISAGLASVGFALITPVSLIILCIVPLDLRQSVVSLIARLLMATVACSLPFYFSGLTLTAILTKYDLPIGKLYACDLVGASLGCLLVLFGLKIFDAPGLILISASIGALAAICLLRPLLRRSSLSSILALFFLLLALAWMNSRNTHRILPLMVKGRAEPASSILLEKWNSFSLVTVYKRTTGTPQSWGRSPRTPKLSKIPQYHMRIDGEAGTTLRRFSSLQDIDHLRYDVTNIAYYLRSGGSACVIGVGGARDVQSAILFGHQQIDAIDVNPIFIELLQDHFRSFAGVADSKGVKLIAAEARSYLTNTSHRYDLVQMSLVDTWAATGAGAFSLSENSLYTVEAWEIILKRLNPNGIFTVSRWFSPDNLGETGRMVSLAVASLYRLGIRQPKLHIAMVSTWNVSSLLVSRQPFRDQDLQKLRQVAGEMQFDLVIDPNKESTNTALREILSAKSFNDLRQFVQEMPLNFDPPTDEKPYFFNMLRLTHLDPLSYKNPGVLQGNLIAILTLAGLILCLLVLTIVTILVPLMIYSRTKQRFRIWKREIGSGAAYFSLIGAGFMLAEIALIQRLSVFLGHPVYALGILLFTMIAGSGLGSYISDGLPLTRSSWKFLIPLLAACVILVTRVLLNEVMVRMIAAGLLTKIIASILMIFPLGLLLGFFFPMGMRLFRTVSSDEIPWFWALNGVFGVLCSALAVLISIQFGISTNLYISSICYFLISVSLLRKHSWLGPTKSQS